MSISHTLSHPTLPNKPATYPQEILSSNIVLVKNNQGVWSLFQICWQNTFLSKKNVISILQIEH